MVFFYYIFKLIVGNGLDRSADLKRASDTFGTVKTVPYTVIFNYFSLFDNSVNSSSE